MVFDVRHVAGRLGLDPAHVEAHGPHRAKVSLEALGGGSEGSRSRLVLVTAITPTAAGEGKTVTAIGLSMGLQRRGHPSVVTLRQSSVGPTLGLKGGGAGGGAATVVPLEECLLGPVSDLFGVEAANNLLAACIDDALWRGAVDLDPASVSWRRVVDMDDRALRRIVTDAGGRSQRETGFSITAASEVMAILAQARDLDDLRRGLGSIVVGFSGSGEAAGPGAGSGGDRVGSAVTAESLGAAGAMAVLLRDAARPNLFATAEGTPALVHAGPFANIATGTSSVIADRIALAHADWVVTEAGFGADLGAEKFLHVKVPALGTEPDVVVLVATVRALADHGRRLVGDERASRMRRLSAGLVNLRHHVGVLRRFGLPVVVTVNRFGDETPEEVDAVAAAAAEAGAAGSVPHDAFATGGAGCEALAEAVESAVGTGRGFAPLFTADLAVREKIRVLATDVYGAEGVAWAPGAERALSRYEAAGFGTLPVCMAKTPLSLSHDPELAGAPSGWTLPVRDVRLSAGAGFVYALVGDVVTMPGLPSRPRFRDLDLDEGGGISGLQ